VGLRAEYSSGRSSEILDSDWLKPGHEYNNGTVTKLRNSEWRLIAGLVYFVFNINLLLIYCHAHGIETNA